MILFKIIAIISLVLFQNVDAYLINSGNETWNEDSLIEEMSTQSVSSQGKETVTDATDTRPTEILTSTNLPNSEAKALDVHEKKQVTRNLQCMT